MKVSILGRGNAGCITAMYLAYFNPDIELELLYDSNIKPVPTGQGTTLLFPNLLFHLFNYKIDDPNFKCTMKHGIMYEGWGKLNEKIFHDFALTSHSIHFHPAAFQDYVCSKLKKKIKMKEVDEHIVSYDSLDSDFIIDCRGKPETLDDTYEMLNNPLNTALLANLPIKPDDVKWTRTIAHPNGWCFYIPLPHTTSLGYLYNSNITSEEEATKDFQERLGVGEVKKFPFEQYVKKQPVVNDRVMLNGNRLFFLEPLEATAMDTYYKCAVTFADYMNKVITKQEATHTVNRHVRQVENFILWHYLNGSKYDTPFWSHATNMAENNLRGDFKAVVNNVKNMSYKELNDRLKTNIDIYYGLSNSYNLRVWYDGVNMKGDNTYVRGN